MKVRLSSLFILPRILGLFPFDNRFQWSKKWMIYCVFINLLTIPTMVIGFIHYYFIIVSSHMKAVSIFIILIWITNLLSFFSNVFTVFHLTRKREMVSHLLDSINKEIVECRGFPKTRFYAIYFFFFCSTSLIFLWTYFYDCSFNMENMILSLKSIQLSASSISVTSMVWELMRVLKILFREATKGYDEGSIISLERMSTYGEYINEIYGPFLFISVIGHMVQFIYTSYLFLLPAFPGVLRINIILLLFISLTFVKLVTVIYASNSYLFQVILIQFIFFKIYNTF